MSRDIAAEIEKEYGEVTFDHPIIQFGYNKIEIRQKFDIYTKIFLFLLFVPIIIFFFVVDVPFPLYFMLFPFFSILYAFYKYYNFFDDITIDFMSKELIIVNRLPFVNNFRRLIKRPSSIPFNDIAYFMTSDGKPGFMLPGRSSDMYLRKTSLYVVPKFKTPILLAGFQFERDARRLGQLLQFNITGRTIQLR